VTQYGYDALGRLRAALSPRGEELFAFDPAHNLMEPEQARREEAKARKTQWTEEEWSAYVQANLDNPDFNPLLTPAEAASDPSAWGESKPNRLRVWQEHRYAYDAWGNCIEKKSGPNQVRRFDWDADHQLSRATIEKRNGRFVHVERWGYDYDPFGRRIAKYRLDRNSTRSPRPWQDPDATHFAWDGNRLLLERQGGRQSLYLYEPDSFVPLALVRSQQAKPVPEDDVPLPAEWLALKDLHPEHWAATTGAMQRKIETKRQARRERLGLVDEDKTTDKDDTAEILYFHTDHLGTPRELTDERGRIVWSATYKAWGNTAQIDHPAQPIRRVIGNTQLETWEAQGDPVVQNLRFQGQYFDTETGLHYNRFRYYDPDIGRFVSQDPIGLAGGVNNYRYAPSPVNYIDPLGLDTRSDAIKLAENLSACGDSRPNSRHRAHHIIMSNSTDPKMVALRDKMKVLGIDINSAENGVWLPETVADRLPGSTKTAHKGEGVHGQDYQNTLHELLIDANTKEEFLSRLADMKQKLEGGAKFKLGCCCRLSVGGVK